MKKLIITGVAVLVLGAAVGTVSATKEHEYKAPHDLCHNIEGKQKEVPEGKVQEGKNCVDKPVIEQPTPVTPTPVTPTPVVETPVAPAPVTQPEYFEGK